jgi:hypothetical protein
VNSQHLHISVNRKIPNPGAIFQKYKTSANYNEDIVIASFNKVLPLVLLPEEYEKDDYSEAFEVWTKGDGDTVPKHPEFKLLSSEYACDPILNLSLSLRAFYASLIDPEYVSSKTSSLKNEYELEVLDMAKDPELVIFFGESTLKTLAGIISQYPDVSRREITVDQIKNQPIEK